MRYLVGFMLEMGTYTPLPKDQKFTGSSPMDAARLAKVWFKSNPPLLGGAARQILVTDETCRSHVFEYDRV